MKIEMRRSFGPTTLSLSQETIDNNLADGIITLMFAILDAAEGGPHFSLEELRAARGDIMAEGGEGKIPQGGAADIEGNVEIPEGAKIEPIPPEPYRDAYGVVWDGRYHAATKAKQFDGAWKIRKGLSDSDWAIAKKIRQDGYVGRER